MINIVLYEPEIPGNTGNIMRTCAGTYAKLHLIEPLGFKLDEKNIKRSGVNYIEHCDYIVYKNFEDFKSKNIGTYYYLSRYGKSHTHLLIIAIKMKIFILYLEKKARVFQKKF